MAGFFSSLFEGGKGGSDEYETSDVFRDLRQKVFQVDPASLGLSTASPNRIWGMLMETGYPEAVASLLAVADGTVSLYFSNGGGIIGAGQHDGPRRASEAWLASASAFLSHAERVRDFPLPRKGATRFYFLTFDGILTLESGTEDLGERRSPMSPLFYKAQEVLTQVRSIDEQRTGKIEERDGSSGLSAFDRLMRAAVAGDGPELRRLLSKGADPNLADPTGLTPLMAASYLGKDDAVRILLDARSSIEARDDSGYTALMFACNGGRLKCAQVLIERGAAVHSGANDGSTPVMFAAQHGHNEIVRLLLSRGADPHVKGQHGLSAIAFALQNGLTETVNILLAKPKVP